MINEWTDRLPPHEAEAIWRRQAMIEFDRRLANIERSLNADATVNRIEPSSFYDAMRHFLTLREQLFPGLPADPAWKILVTLASEPESSTHRSVTGIAYGANVPLTTALRYIAALEMEHVIERVPAGDDKRRVNLRLTTEGRRRLDSIAEKWKIRLAWATIIPGITGAALMLPMG